MKLSIIIPVYKVEAYIEKCIRSLEDQDMPKDDYEILVVNDGSPDRCREIIENLQKEFDNIVLLNQENQGVSMARNNAMAIARGAYLLPIDADDYVHPKVLQRAYDKAISSKLDVLYLGFEILDIHGEIIWQTNYKNQQEILYSGPDGYFSSRVIKNQDSDRSCAILYKREMIQQYKITYPKDVPILEDGLFLGKVFAVANSVGFMNQIFYIRTTRLDSAINSNLVYSEKAIQGFFYALLDLRNFTRTTELDLKQVQLINHLFAKYFLLALSDSLQKINFKKYFDIITKLKRNGFENLATEGVKQPYKNFIKMFNYNSLLFWFYYKFYYKVTSKIL